MPDKSAATPALAAALRRAWGEGDHGGALRGALAGWRELLESDADLGWLEQALRAHGGDTAALELAVRNARREGAASRRWPSLLRSILDSGDPWWALILLDEIGAARREMQAVQIEASLETGADVTAPVVAWLGEHRDSDAADAAVRWLIAGGHLAEAERLLAGRPDLAAWRARMALWRGRPDAARAALREIADSPQCRCMTAIADLLDGDLDGAETRLREVAESAGADEATRGEAWSWIATIRRRQGRYREVPQAVDAANRANPSFVLAPRLERELAFQLESGGSRRPASRLDRLRAWWRRETRRTVGELEYAPLLLPLGARLSDPIAVGLEKALARLGGNRTPYPTLLEEDGHLAPLRLPLDPRHHGATIQRVMWTRGPAAARRLYRDFQPDVGAHPLSRIYQGEVELWAGQYAAAEAIFRGILAEQRHTLWAWIGLGAARMFQGDLRGALPIWEEGVAEMRFEGPTLFVYRGECRRRLGMREAARADLETALHQKPQRLGARINLALLDGGVEALAAAERECVAFAPILMETLDGSPEQRLEAVLEAMRGNRSSSPDQMSYHLWGQIWRRASVGSRVGGEWEGLKSET